MVRASHGEWEFAGNDVGLEPANVLVRNGKGFDYEIQYSR